MAHKIMFIFPCCLHLPHFPPLCTHSLPPRPSGLLAVPPVANTVLVAKHGPISVFFSCTVFVMQTIHLTGGLNWWFLLKSHLFRNAFLSHTMWNATSFWPSMGPSYPVWLFLISCHKQLLVWHVDYPRQNSSSRKAETWSVLSRDASSVSQSKPDLGLVL